MTRDTLREREPHFVDIVVLDGLGSKLDAMCDFTLCTVSNRSAVMGGTMPMAALFGGAFAHPAFKVEFAGEETFVMFSTDGSTRFSDHREHGHPPTPSWGAT